MFRRLTFVFAFLVSNLMLYGQPLWMQPKDFFLMEGERLLVTFRSGSNFTGQPWEFNRNDVSEITLHQLSQSKSVTDSLSAGQKESLKLTIAGAGSSLITLATKPSTRSVSGEEFDDYLKDNGLDEVLSQRKRENKLGSEAQESLKFFSKLLFQNGKTIDDTYAKSIGHPVEIIPLKNPLQLKVGDELRFKILINGKSVFGTRVKVWNRFNNRTTIQNIYTEQDGTILVRISSPGPWMISFAAVESNKGGESLLKTNHGSYLFGVKR